MLKKVRSLIGLDIGTNCVKAVELTQAGSDLVVTGYGQSEILSEGSKAFYRELPCSPCITVANYRSSRCRIHTCMATIPTGEAVSAMRSLLRGLATVERVGQGARGGES